MSVSQREQMLEVYMFWGSVMKCFSPSNINLSLKCLLLHNTKLYRTTGLKLKFIFHATQAHKWWRFSLIFSQQAINFICTHTPIPNTPSGNISTFQGKKSIAIIREGLIGCILFYHIAIWREKMFPYLLKEKKIVLFGCSHGNLNIASWGETLEGKGISIN